jgi:hypothetical protein
MAFSAQAQLDLPNGLETWEVEFGELTKAENDMFNYARDAVSDVFANGYLAEGTYNVTIAGHSAEEDDMADNLTISINRTVK